MKIAAVVSAFVSNISVVMLLDMAFVALHITDQAFFRHPFWEGGIMLYGMGTACIGVLLVITALRSPDEPAGAQEETF